MLGSILTAAVPVVATIAVALYVLRKIQQYGTAVSQRVMESDMTMEEQPDSGFYSGSSRENRAGSARHRRPHPYQNRNRASRGLHAGQDPNSIMSSEDALKGQAFDGIEKECAVCFEQIPCVVLYPCYHSGVCINCINKVITDGDRRCPFCRRFIEAYRT